MAEVQNLVIDLDNTKGWDNSGGKSNNVWGQVPMPKEIISIANKAKSKKKLVRTLMGEGYKFKMPSIWTAYDKIIYASADEITEEDLPKTISATFKSCFSKYTAVVENMSMRIAYALDLPTSYNYIVKFDPNEYPKIIDNYYSQSKKQTVSKLGIVSIDFLQSSRGVPTKEVYTDLDENGNPVEVESFYDVDGDVLIPFDDIVTEIIGNNRLSGDQNLIENWVLAVDKFVQEKLSNLPRENLNKIIDRVHSRIARSFLLKEYCGDCDNTSYNATIVFNKLRGTLVYGPNHDFGDSFNKLLKAKIDKSQTMSMEDINKLPEYIRKMMLDRLKKEEKESVADIARQYSVVEASERNMKYILENFPESAREFFESVDKCVQNKSFYKIVDSYTRMSCDGEPLLTSQEAEIFKEYLMERSTWMVEVYVNYLNEHGKQFEPVSINDDSVVFN